MLAEGCKLSPRQQREIDFHREYAQKRRREVQSPPKTNVVHDTKRRWWNAYWHLYTIVKTLNLHDKKVLVVGCGFGDDAILLTEFGAKVYAVDISPESVEIARERSARATADVEFFVMPAEKMDFADSSFDAAFFVDILHHVDIPRAVKEMRRVLKPSGLVIGNELYTHSWLQRVRESWLVSSVLYPRMQRFIYETDTPYITADEHKIDEGEFAVICSILDITRLDYFNIAEGRLFPTGRRPLSQIDRTTMKALGFLGRFVASRVIFVGQVI